MLSIALVRSTKEASGATNAMTATSSVDSKVVLYTIGKDARKSSIGYCLIDVSRGGLPILPRAGLRSKRGVWPRAVVGFADAPKAT